MVKTDQIYRELCFPTFFVGLRKFSSGRHQHRSVKNNHTFALPFSGGPIVTKKLHKRGCSHPTHIRFRRYNLKSSSLSLILS